MHQCWHIFRRTEHLRHELYLKFFEDLYYSLKGSRSYVNDLESMILCRWSWPMILWQRSWPMILVHDLGSMILCRWSWVHDRVSTILGKRLCDRKRSMNQSFIWGNFRISISFVFFDKNIITWSGYVKIGSCTDSAIDSDSSGSGISSVSVIVSSFWISFTSSQLALWLVDTLMPPSYWLIAPPRTAVWENVPNIFGW